MNKYTGLEIAVIGMSIKCPGANSITDYWENLLEGKESIKRLTKEELLERGVSEENIENPNYINASGAMDDYESFDANFFNYLHHEAIHLDPQTRLFHEITWEALEDAGCNPDAYPGMIGMFVGVPLNAMWKVHSSLAKNDTGLSSYYIEILNSKDNLPMLISNKLNLQGPSFSLNTACSSSLVAVHQACRAILTGDCNVAVAGGITLDSNAKGGYYYEDGLIFSPDGHCRPFDTDANGTIFSEGAGAVVLKKLSEAIKDGDHIYGIIKGSAINNDGNRKLGYMSPSIDGQIECARKALIMSKVESDSISYIEAHGTGTKLGDPVELKALEQAYRLPSGKKCAIGSVKSNVGHLDVASGVAGLIKVLLSLDQKKIPASINFKKGNENIDFNKSPFYINDTLKSWKQTDENPLRAAISAFGIGGTNAHIILEEAQDKAVTDVIAAPLFVFSAKTKKSLESYIEKYIKYLSKENGLANLSDLAYSLAVGRKDFDYKLSITCSDKNDLIARLNEAITKDLISEPAKDEHSIVFMFSGQGSQYKAMGKEMYDNIPFFRLWIDKGLEVLESLSDEDFRQFIFLTTETEGFEDTKYVQPLLFVFEYAIAQYLMHLGIMPKFMIGHSVGEYVAAALADVFSYEEGLMLMVERGKLMNALPKGAMLSVALSYETVQDYLEDGLSIASINGPDQVVVSGDLSKIEALSEVLESKGITNIKLRTSHAFHSAMMDPILEDFRLVLKKINLKEPKMPYVSNLTGALVQAGEVTSETYWLDHLRHAVRFSEGIHTLINLNANVFLELGPGKTLTALLRQNIANVKGLLAINMIATKDYDAGADFHFTEKIGQLWTNGVKINWISYYAGKHHRKIPMPTYAFEKTQYQVVVGNFDSIKENGFQNAKPEKKEILDSFYIPSWKKTYLVKNGDEPLKGCGLFFSEECDFSEQLKDTFTEKQSDLLIVKRGNAFSKISEKCYEMNPNDPNDYKQLFADLENREIIPEYILYNWKSKEDIILSDKISLDENVLGFYCIQNILKGLITTDRLKNSKIILLTEALYQVVNTEYISTKHAVTSGLLKVISQEMPSVFACIIDIDLNEKKHLATLPESIYNEVTYNNTDKTVALRNSTRWVQYIEDIHIKKRESTKLKQKGVYLITGGLGHMGYTIACHLLEQYNANLILIGRTALPSESEWTDAVLESNSKVYHMNQLLKRSGNVAYFCTDINDQNRFETFMATAEAKFGPVNGVIHTAGILHSDYFMHCDKIDIVKALEQIAPKLHGTKTLYSYFKDRDLDFAWLSSSLSSFLGGMGIASYCSGNIFMDTFVTQQAKESPNWISVNLDYLNFNDQKEKKSINKNELIEAFEASLELDGINQVIVAKGNIHERFKKYVLDKLEIEPDSVEVEKSKVNRNSITSHYIEPSSDTEIRLLEIWSSFLNINNIGVVDDFFELGGDSLKGMGLLKLIMNEFGVKINLVELFDNPSIKTLAFKIDKELSAAQKGQKGEKNIII